MVRGWFVLWVHGALSLMVVDDFNLLGVLRHETEAKEGVLKLMVSIGDDLHAVFPLQPSYHKVPMGEFLEMVNK